MPNRSAFVLRPFIVDTSLQQAKQANNNKQSKAKQNKTKQNKTNHQTKHCCSGIIDASNMAISSSNCFYLLSSTKNARNRRRLDNMMRLLAMLASTTAIAFSCLPLHRNHLQMASATPACVAVDLHVVPEFINNATHSWSVAPENIVLNPHQEWGFYTVIVARRRPISEVNDSSIHHPVRGDFINETAVPLDELMMMRPTPSQPALSLHSDFSRSSGL